MKKIYKYPLNLAEVNEIEMDDNAEYLCIQTQNGYPHLWALIDDNSPTRLHGFLTVGTGHHVDDRADSYIDTYQQGAYVWHIFSMK